MNPILTLSIRTRGGSIRLAAEAGHTADVLSRLAPILSLKCEPYDPALRPDAVFLAAPPPPEEAEPLHVFSKYIRLYHFPNGTIGVIDNISFYFIRVSRILITAGYLAAILRGESVCFIHGVLLDMGNGGANVMFADSEVGKSTTARRFRSAGGASPADDQIILARDAASGEFYAYPMPTWSIYQAHPPYPAFDTKLEFRLNRLLLLSRGKDRESIVPVDKIQYKTQLLRAITLHSARMIKVFPPDDAPKLGAAFYTFAEALAQSCRAEALEAHLQGNLAETLGFSR